MTLKTQLDRIEGLLAALVARRQPQAWYTVDEFARLIGKAPFTVRQWCRLGRIIARKKACGRGAHASWSISHEEFERFQKDGLLPAHRPDEPGNGSGGDHG